MYTSEKRVERGGFLIAFEGEVMTEADAEKRGLLDSDDPAVEPKRTKANYIAEAEARGLDASGTVADLIARLTEADELYGPGVPKPATEAAAAE